MKGVRNKIDENFLKKYRRASEPGVTYIPLKAGFLKLEYGLSDDPSILSLVSYVLDDIEEAIAVGPRLEMTLTEDGITDTVTYITENGISGVQWSDGEVFWGNTYDDDLPHSAGRIIDLDEWIDECINKMINPDDKEIVERRKLDLKDKEYADLLKKRNINIL